METSRMIMISVVVLFCLFFVYVGYSIVMNAMKSDISIPKRRCPDFHYEMDASNDKGKYSCRDASGEIVYLDTPMWSDTVTNLDSLPYDITDCSLVELATQNSALSWKDYNNPTMIQYCNNQGNNFFNR